ncbi:GNAT family N-acetyltransferase [Nocardioides albidus]|uniref:GNAT family N-acetyltransferase n=1 Tax=Nocardioides albidus TaxID=1517589 RepID=A0A5C4VUN6_9ACTN|nr:GNAT family N-acetyltransferase [Nocardioides albidus]TNM39593.1 GNAT family N-acetyltransferase [Nocardioides albidus]
MTIEDFRSDHVPAVGELFARLPESDLTFIKEDVSPQAVAAWPDAPGRRWVHVEPDGTVVGLAALLPLTGWSDHVGELRLVVDPAGRGRGIGRSLAQHALAHSLRSGQRKVVVEVPAAHERIIEMFLALGFTGEALLRDHFRDRSGALQDLIMLAHLADQTFESMSAVGLDDLLEGN